MTSIPIPNGQIYDLSTQFYPFKTAHIGDDRISHDSEYEWMTPQSGTKYAFLALALALRTLVYIYRQRRMSAPVMNDVGRSAMY